MEVEFGIEGQRISLITEEASKAAIVLRFLQALGCDMVNPMEVVP